MRNARFFAYILYIHLASGLCAVMARSNVYNKYNKYVCVLGSCRVSHVGLVLFNVAMYHLDDCDEVSLNNTVCCQV